MKHQRAIFSIFDHSTFRHLRFPFSFFLMPVYLFALSQAKEISWFTAIPGFLIIHGLLFPSTNGYNSFQDRDETSIGGLKHPPPVSQHLFYTTLMMDVVAIISGLMISIVFSGLLLVFISISRLYSYRKIRLKKYPVIAFLIVFVFQGGYVYLLSSESIHPGSFNEIFTPGNILCMLIASLFIGSMYPLTQIYQHDADKNDGVISLSYMLGYKGTFVFSAVLFAIAVSLLFYYLNYNKQMIMLILFVLFIVPVVIRLYKWFHMVKKNTRHANYENTMHINLLSSVCMNAYFLLLVIYNQIRLF